MLPTKRLREPLLRRAVLRGIADGDTLDELVERLDIAKSSVHRYGRAFPRFRDRMREARTMRGSTEEEIAAFIASEPVGEPGTVDPMALDKLREHEAALIKVIEIDGPAQPHSDVIDPEVIRAPGSASGPAIPLRSCGAFYDKMWLDVNNAHISDVRVIAASRILHAHYDTERKRAALIEVEMARQGTTTSDRPRGLTAEAKRRTLHSIIGPPPEDEPGESEDEVVA